MLVELYITVGDAVDNLLGHFGHLLSLFALESVGHEPFPHKLLGELTLVLAFCKAFLIAFGIEITAAVGSVNLVDEVNPTVAFAEFIFGVDKYQAFGGGNLGTPLEESQGVFLQLLVVLLVHKTGTDNLLAGDILIVSLVGLGGGSKNGCREFLVFHHSLGQWNAAQGAGTGFVFAPSAACQIATDNHFDTEPLAFEAHGHHRVGRSQFPVGDDVGGGIKEFSSNLVQHLAFIGNTLGQDNVEGTDAVADHHGHIFIIDIIDIAHFAYIQTFLFGEGEVCLYYCFHDFILFDCLIV